MKLAGNLRVCVSVCGSVNVGCGQAEERVLLTGLHAVADIYCECCKTTLGWKYVSSNGPLQRYVPSSSLSSSSSSWWKFVSCLLSTLKP